VLPKDPKKIEKILSVAPAGSVEVIDKEGESLGPGIASEEGKKMRPGFPGH
jgi:hypothetical protein